MDSHFCKVCLPTEALELVCTMTSTAAPSPSSLQLRLALNCGNRVGHRTLLVRTTLAGRLGGHCRLLSLARNGNEARRRRDGCSCIRADSAADTFSGWSNNDNSELSNNSQRKQWFGGIRRKTFLVENELKFDFPVTMHFRSRYCRNVVYIIHQMIYERKVIAQFVHSV